MNRAEQVEKTESGTALLYGVIFAFMATHRTPEEITVRASGRQSQRATESDDRDIELLGVCYTNVKNKSSKDEDTVLLPTDRKKYAIRDQCTFMTRLEKQHKKRLVSNHRVYCTYSETQSEWDRLYQQLILENQSPEKLIVVSYGLDAHAVLEQVFTATCHENITMESQYMNALYDVRVGVTPTVRVTDAAKR